ncbi:MAG: L,D-transpeptidase, partial [Anaerolineales bacterium]|nr:L,D-transpeptidase [Anaerolineales bacterium]
IVLIPLLVIALLSTPSSAQAQERVTSPVESALCLPGVYTEAPEDCLPLGPSAYLTEMAASGITLPLESLPIETPDPSLTYVPYNYGRVNTGPAPVFNSLEAAIEGKHPSRYIDTGFNYVSYTNVETDDKGRKFYLIGLNEWMRGADLTGNIATGTFQGVTLTTTPKHKFGWVLFPIETQIAPDFNAAYTGKQYDRWEMVQVYEIKQVEDFNWYLIGPDEWVDERYIGVIYPNTTPPEGVDNGRWIDINLFEQTIAVYQDYQMVFATLISTGVPGFWTRPGLFQIYDKLETTPMTGAFEADRSDFYYLEDVPWTMYFDEARALHGAYWHTKLGYVQSHGCVNLSPGDSAWFYNWGQVGDWVYVWDPSGDTPTDPSLYGSGGA